MDQRQERWLYGFDIGVTLRCHLCADDRCTDPHRLKQVVSFWMVIRVVSTCAYNDILRLNDILIKPMVTIAIPFDVYRPLVELSGMMRCGQNITGNWSISQAFNESFKCFLARIARKDYSAPTML